MNDEQLSALIDDALPQEVTREAVTALLAEAPARATWRRYHLIGDALRASSEQPVSTRQPHPHSDNVVPFPPFESLPKPVRKPLSRAGLGLAAAAALAGVALIVVSNPAPDNGAAPNNIAMTAELGVPAVSVPVTVVRDAELMASANEVAGEAFAPPGVSQTGIIKEDEAQKRMNTYLINFNEQRARQRTPGVHPYVRIVGYDTP
ncbi:unnamed protein product [Phaeothamnion confervicola]